MHAFPPVPRYAILLKNGQVLRHQDPINLAQFRSDVRLDKVWLEGSVSGLSGPDQRS